MRPFLAGPPISQLLNGQSGKKRGRQEGSKWGSRQRGGVMRELALTCHPVVSRQQYSSNRTLYQDCNVPQFAAGLWLTTVSTVCLDTLLGVGHVTSCSECLDQGIFLVHTLFPIAGQNVIGKLSQIATQHSFEINPHF